jgi:hypothetical protein
MLGFYDERLWNMYGSFIVVFLVACLLSTTTLSLSQDSLFSTEFQIGYLKNESQMRYRCVNLLIQKLVLLLFCKWLMSIDIIKLNGSQLWHY